MKFNVILTTPSWGLSGVNTVSLNLLRGLNQSGISVKILLTEPYYQETNPIPLPSNIPVETLPVTEKDSWQVRWQLLIRYLEQQAPCIYIPNYDWRHSCISPKLSKRVIIVGIVHSDDPMHYNHVSRLGKYWNAIVAVSETVGKKTAALDYSFCSRLVTIPNGVPIASSCPQRLLEVNAPLKIIYTGRLVQYQKRVFDLIKIMETLHSRQIPVELTLVGDGTEAQLLQEKFQSFIERGNVRFLGTLPNEQVLELYEQHDIFLLTSDFEGMPISLLEAMGRGCIPVVTDLASGIPELVQNGVQGFRVPVGDIQQFADCITRLQQNVQLRQEMTHNAYRKINEGGYRTEDMVKRYMELFQRVVREAKSGAFRRPCGEILPPPLEINGISIFYEDPQVSWIERLIEGKRTLKRNCRQIFQRIRSVINLKKSKN